jgi:hypothetical protein
VLALLIVARLRPLANADLLWQIASGDAIAAQRRRLAVDLFSASFRGAPLHDHEPLWELLVAAIHRAGGFAAMWWTALAVALACGLAAYRAAARIAPSPIARAVAIALVLVAVAPRLDLRAEWVGFAAIAVAHHFRPRHWTIPIVIAAIAAPFHGLAVLCALVSLAHHTRRDLIAAAAIPLVVFAISPSAIFSIVDHLRAPTFTAHLVEYYSPWRYIAASGDPAPILALTLAGVSLAAARDRADRFLVAMLIVPALFRVRFTALCVLGTLPVVIGGVASILDRALSRTRLAPALALLVTGAAMTVLTVDLGLRPTVGFDWSEQPVDAVRAIRTDARLFHSFNFGAYLIYAGRPVWIDPRAATLYPESHARAYYATTIDDLAAFDTVLLHRRHKGTATLRAALYGDPRFRVHYEDAVAVVFTRR